MSHYFSTVGRKASKKTSSQSITSISSSYSNSNKYYTYSTRAFEPISDYSRNFDLLTLPAYYQYAPEIKYPTSHKIKRKHSNKMSTTSSKPQQQQQQQKHKTVSNFPVHEMEYEAPDRFDFNVRFAVNGMSKFVPGNDVPEINKSILAGDFGDDSGMVAENSNSIFIG